MSHVELAPLRMVFQVFTEPDHRWAHCLGEVECFLDSEETAMVAPCARLSMTEDVLCAIAEVLRPLGVKWMRGWGDGGRQGRVITATGLLNEY